MNVLGKTTESIFLKQIQSHKLHQEFTVAVGSAVKVGMPVKLDDAGDIVPFAEDDEKVLLIGYSVHNAAAEENATIGMVAFGIIWAMSAGAVDPSLPVKVKGVSGANSSYMEYENVAAANAEDALATGWSLDAATGAGEKIRIAVY